MERHRFVPDFTRRGCKTGPYIPQRFEILHCTMEPACLDGLRKNRGKDSVAGILELDTSFLDVSAIRRGQIIFYLPKYAE